MYITRIQTDWPEAQGFELSPRDVGNEYVFFHFLSHGMVHSSYIDLVVDPGACVLYKKHTRMHVSAPHGPIVFDRFHLRGDLTDLMRKYRLCFNQVYYPKDSPAVSQLVRSMEKEFYYPGACSEDFYEAQVTALLLTLTKDTLRPCALSADTELHARLNAARQTLRTRFTEAWDTDTMAALAGMGRTAFYEAYKHLFGITPKQELIACRIGHAETLLEQQKYSVEEVARRCGYATVSHFIRQFKAATGATPSKFFCL